MSGAQELGAPPKHQANSQAKSAPKAKSESIAKAAPKNALDRLASFGSTLYTAPQAKAEPAKAAVPKVSPIGPPGQMKGPLAATQGYMPGQMYTDVTSAKPTAVGVPRAGWRTTPGVGSAAHSYAIAAQQALDEADPDKTVPREGPAAVAVARSLAAGKGAVIKGGTKPRTAITKRYQIVLVSAELGPYSKTGGLGEAMDGLSVALAGLGHRVMVITPRYDQYRDAWDTSFWSTVDMGGKKEPVHFFHAYKQKVDQVFVDHPCFLAAVWGLTGSKLYGPQFGEDYVDNQARFSYFCKCALIAIKQLPLAGFPYGDDVVIVCNDWHAGLVPMMVEAEREMKPGSFAKNRTKVLSLTHNAVYQGRFKLEAGLDKILNISQKFVKNITFNMRFGESNEKTACVNHLAASLLYCDRALTVSPSYAEEISSIPEKGVELQDLYAKKQPIGILNGVKEAVSPLNEVFVKKCKIICGTFTANTVDTAKAKMKASYRKSCGLPESTGPMMCFIGRLDVQKGYDLIIDALEEVLPTLQMQVVIIGAGKTALVTRTKTLAKKYPTKLAYEGWMGPERYGVLTACDYTIFFSRWEPCGLVQMECMRLGTVPIVAPTGGLKDSTEDGITGFWTDQPMDDDENTVDKESVASISRVLRKVCEVYTSSPEKVSAMRKAAMAAAAQFTWTNAALQYEAVFDEMGAVNVLPRVAKGEGATVTLEEDDAVL